MTSAIIVWSLGSGIIAGLLYGFFFLKHDLAHVPASSNPKHIRKEKFLSFFLMAALRIVLIMLLWHYVLRSASLNIILVLIAFLVGFWAIILRKKVLHE